MRSTGKAGLVLALAALLPPSVYAKELVAPVGVFVEGGISDDSRSLVLGAAWTWVQPSKWGAGNASGYLETSVGEWACHRGAGAGYRGCSTQIGLTPVLRYEPEWWTRWYMELGNGADEIELRAEHYSNGGYRHPNPGENWFQLRYMHWFK